MIDRRHLLGLGLGACGALALPSVRLFAAEAPAGPRLVVVLLRGAVDGLNVVVPYRDSDYRAGRPTIGLDAPGGERGVLDLDGHFGLHPALKALVPLWQAKRIAFVQAAGSPDPTRSHFDAQHFLETAVPGDPGRADGWLNRVLGVLPGSASPMRAINLGPVRPRILAGPEISSNVGGALGKRLPVDRPAVEAAFAQLYQGDDAISRTWRQGIEARHQLQDDLSEEAKMANGGAPPAEQFGRLADQLATLMRTDPRVQIAEVELGGWDTHVNQGAATGQLAKRLAALGDGLAAFATRLDRTLDDTVVLVMSEFGRAAHENGGGGTDHGHGNVIWLMGGRVAGGKVWGEWPGLEPAALYDRRDLAVTTDYRSVIALVLTRHLRLGDKAMSVVVPNPPPSSRAIAGLIAA